jgi:hypothetical protein
MAVIYPYFLRSILAVHENIESRVPYPFFDPACTYYESLRSVLVDGWSIQEAMDQFGLSEYGFNGAREAFKKLGAIGLIGLDARRFVEDLPLGVERKVFVLKQARPWIPATKMCLILKGFNENVDVTLMRHLYASYGWAAGTRKYTDIDFSSLNLKVRNLVAIRSQRKRKSKNFFDRKDILQQRLEVFRTIGERGITKRYKGSRVSLSTHRKNFLAFGLIGLVDCARSPIRNSKLGYKEEGRIILSKIQKPEKSHDYFLRILESKKIKVGATCLINIFKRWKVDRFQSAFKGDLDRLLEEGQDGLFVLPKPPDGAEVLRVDRSFNSFMAGLTEQPVALANPGLFLFLPYLNRLKIYEKIASLMDLDPSQGYSWFSLLLLSLGRIFAGISSSYKACQVQELSLPLNAGLVSMPCVDTLLNGLAVITEPDLFELRRYLTGMAARLKLIEGKKIAFDFQMRDFTGDDVPLKNIGKGPSPKRKICFPGFRPHLAWDVETGTPVTLEFRNGKARGTTTIKRFINELIGDALGNQVDRVYIDSEYTAEHVWKFIVDEQKGLGADLTMCVKQNKRVKNAIKDFLNTKPTWVYFDDEHTYSEQTFEIPIRKTDKTLRCVLKRKESRGNLRCFGSTISGLDGKAILDEYRKRWTIENGIKDLTENYFFDKVPGIDPHRINIHYFVVTLAKTLYQMLSNDYDGIVNPDKTRKNLGSLRPEFLTGTNAMLSRRKDVLNIKWLDQYKKRKHVLLGEFFEKLNRTPDSRLQFLGGLKVNFELGAPRSDDMVNTCVREFLEF